MTTIMDPALYPGLGPATVPMAPDGGRPVVLVIENDHFGVVQRVLKAAIRDYEVLVVGMVGDAVAFLERNGPRVVCVFVEESLPHINGCPVPVFLNVRYEDLPLILCSQLDKEYAACGMADCLAGFLQKPLGYSPAGIRNALNMALHRRPAPLRSGESWS